MTNPAAQGFLDCWLRMGQLVDGAWMRREENSAVGATGLPMPTLNGLWITDGLSARRVSELLDELRGSGLPHCLQLPADGAVEVVATAQRQGMQRFEDVPLMLLSEPPPQPPSDLTFHALPPDEVGRHAEVAAAGFAAPIEMFQALIAPRFAADADTTVVVAQRDGVDVSTGVSVTIGGRCGIFNIATAPAHRRRGYGAAVTAWLVTDGFGKGASHAWLQSSTAGYSTYERLGFRTVDTWQCWITT